MAHRRGHKTHRRSTHRKHKSHRRHTHKRRHHRGGRGGMGGAELGHAFTTGASQELYQMTGKTPGLSSGGGSKSTKRRRNETRKQRARNAEIKRRHEKFSEVFVVGMPISGHEGHSFKHLSRNEMKNKIRIEALSKYVEMFGNNEGFNELNLKLTN